MLDIALSQVVRHAADGTGSLPRPLQATINVTSRCNSRCTYCSYGDPNFPRVPDPSLTQLVDLISDLACFGVRSLSLSGGEPLLRDDLPDIVRLASEAGMAVTVVTNGTLLTIETAQQLADAGLVNLVISFDTLKDELYQQIRGVPLTKSSSNFYALQEYRRSYHCIPRVAVNAVLTRLNYQSLLADIALFCPWLLPNDSFMVQAYQPPPSLPANKDPLRFRSSDRSALDYLCARLRERKKEGWPIGNDVEFLARLPGFLAAGELPEGYQCLTAYSSLFIKENLDVHPCWQFQPVGNLNSVPVAELWPSAQFELARQRMKRLECRKCALVCHTNEFLDILASLVDYDPFPDR